MKKKVKKKPKFKLKAWAVCDNEGPVEWFSTLKDAKSELWWHYGAKIVKCWVIPMD